MEFIKEAESKKILEDLIDIYSVQNHIMYEYELYDVVLADDTMVGYTLHYKVPGSCYIDIMILPEYRNRGIGSSVLKSFMSKLVTGDVFIKSKELYKNRFLLKNGFSFIEENIYRDLYVYKTR